jgi:uncharacterized protein (TIGR02300 family)
LVRVTTLKQPERFGILALTSPSILDISAPRRVCHRSFGGVDLAKPEWGIKRVCQSCAALFYDFDKSPIVCPKCGTTFDPEAVLKSRRNRVPIAEEAKPARPKVKDEADTEDEDEEEDEVLEDEDEDDEVLPEIEEADPDTALAAEAEEEDPATKTAADDPAGDTEEET